MADSTTASAATPYIHTTTHNYISRQATIEGARQVELKGRNIIEPNVHLHGQRAVIRVGRFVRFDEGVTVIPPSHPAEGNNENIPVTIGSHTWIEASAKIEAAAVGSLCWIGKNVTLGPRVILKDCVVVAEGTIIPADTVIPPFSHMRRVEGVLVRTELPPASAVELEERAVAAFQDFCRKLPTTESGGTKQ